MNDAVYHYLAQYRKLGLDGGPATETEIILLEQATGVLPASYKAYLLLAGREPPRAWVGSDCAMRHLRDLRDCADNLLRENGRPPLPTSAFVFLMHQGHHFFYFETDCSNDDPPVFYYLEGTPEVVRRFERFSELVAECAAEGQLE